ncbi:MAG: DUF3048 domain-containing protein [Candidatus Berkelbacteria bacterium]|nr:DUF3048 domain-containing protein [Candidatus Berkelbacteria bacterium]
MNKKYKTALIISIIVSVFIIGGAIAAKYYPKKESAVNTAEEASTTPEQLTLCMLDGASYKDKQKALRHPLAVVIENHPDARPQSGLIDASLVYEAITEGGITRYLAIYGPKDTKEIGPIRSARLFFMDWLKEYDAFFAHAGGNEDALANIGNYQIKDLNHSQKYFWRDQKGRGVASEHTLYSSTDKLYEYAASKKYDTSSSNFETMKFKASGPANQAGKGVEINFSSASYKVRWSYSPTENKYARFLAGKEHKDLTSGKQITAENIIIQTVTRTLQPHGSYGSQNWVFTTTGSGKATVLRDGEVIAATWKKPARDSRTKFYTEAGVEIEFNPGTTWYEIIPPEVSPSFI